MILYQGDTSQAIPFLLIDSTDPLHMAGKTGLAGGAITLRLGKNSVSAAPTGVIAEIDAANMPGWYKLTPSAADVGVIGALPLHASAAGCDPVDDLHEVKVNPTDIVIDAGSGKTFSVKQIYLLAAAMAAGDIAGIQAGTGAQTLTVRVGAMLLTVLSDDLGNRTVTATFP